MLRVYLGRFAPFHDGHKMLLTKLIKKFGIENCLVMIGSSNVLDERTPFTKEYREGLIKKHFPEVKTMFFDDVGDDDIWLSNLKSLEESMGETFVFYGGSQKDLELLSQKFETHVLVDRFKEGKGINATGIREKMRLTNP